MLVHIVLFWLRDDLVAADREAFFKDLETLKNIPAIEGAYVGTPAETPHRPVIDSSYDACLTVLLRDLAAHDAYQDDPIHHAFLDANRTRWSKVCIYDAD